MLRSKPDPILGALNRESGSMELGWEARHARAVVVRGLAGIDTARMAYSLGLCSVPAVGCTLSGCCHLVPQFPFQ